MRANDSALRAASRSFCNAVTSPMNSAVFSDSLSSGASAIWSGSASPSRSSAKVRERARVARECLREQHEHAAEVRRARRFHSLRRGGAPLVEHRRDGRGAGVGVRPPLDADAPRK